MNTKKFTIYNITYIICIIYYKMRKNIYIYLIYIFYNVYYIMNTKTKQKQKQILQY